MRFESSYHDGASENEFQLGQVRTAGIIPTPIVFYCGAKALAKRMSVGEELGRDGHQLVVQFDWLSQGRRATETEDAFSVVAQL